MTTQARMKERSINLTPEQARAASLGQLRQLRVPTKKQPPAEFTTVQVDPLDHLISWWAGNRPWLAWPEKLSIWLPCPYAPGLVLNCREAWRVRGWVEDDGEFSIGYRDGRNSGAIMLWPDDDTGEKFNALWLECCEEASAKGIQPNGGLLYEWKESPLRWRSPVTMPPGAVRSRLVVKGVEAARVQDITEEDAIKCGADRPEQWVKIGITTHSYRGSYVQGYQASWNARYAKRGLGWETNCWVWVMEVEPVKK